MEAAADIVDPNKSGSPVFFQHYIPGKPLSEFVGVFWYWRGHDVLSPKLFCRVQRFQEVIKTVEKRRDVDWVDIVLSCGYFDQSHFNHDFREFSGTTVAPRSAIPMGLSCAMRRATVSISACACRSVTPGFKRA